MHQPPGMGAGRVGASGLWRGTCRDRSHGRDLQCWGGWPRGVPPAQSDARLSHGGAGALPLAQPRAGWRLQLPTLPWGETPALGHTAHPWQRPLGSNHPMARDLGPEGWRLAGRVCLFGVPEAPSWGALGHLSSPHEQTCLAPALARVNPQLPSHGAESLRLAVGMQPPCPRIGRFLLPRGPLCLPVAGKARAPSAGGKSSLPCEGRLQFLVSAGEGRVSSSLRLRTHFKAPLLVATPCAGWPRAR